MESICEYRTITINWVKQLQVLVCLAEEQYSFLHNVNLQWLDYITVYLICSVIN